MKAEEEAIIKCDYSQCPKAAECKSFDANVDKKTTLHWGAYPFEKKKGRCFIQKDNDEQQTN